MNRAISPVSGFARGFRARMRRYGRRTIIALPAAAISLFVSSLPAFADLKLCNRMSYVVEAAIGIDEKSATATRGWFRIDPAACRVVLQGALTADRIRIEVKAGPAANDAIAAHLDTVKHETLAVAFGSTEATPQGFVAEGKLGDEPIAIGVSRAA